MNMASKLILEKSSGLRNLVIRIFICSMLGLYFIDYRGLAVAGEIAVVVNINNPIKSLTAREVSDIFLARRRSFPSSGSPIVVFEQPRNSSLREEFFNLLNRMSLRRVNAYWARLQFSGDVQPPTILPDSQTVINIVSKNPSAIGYVDAASVDGSVSVILNLKD